MAIAAKVIDYLEVSKAAPFRCVVVEHDWPEYEPTWQAIEKRMNAGGYFEQMKQSSAELAGCSLSREDWKAVVAAVCIDIFTDYDESEVRQMTPAIQRAWEVGKELKRA